MANFRASIKYKYGSGRASTSTTTSTSSIKGNTESAVMALLRDKHKSVKDLVILINTYVLVPGI